MCPCQNVSNFDFLLHASWCYILSGLEWKWCLWVYIHTEKTKKICLTTVRIKPATFGMLFCLIFDLLHTNLNCKIPVIFLETRIHIWVGSSVVMITISVPNWAFPPLFLRVFNLVQKHDQLDVNKWKGDLMDRNWYKMELIVFFFCVGQLFLAQSILCAVQNGSVIATNKIVAMREDRTVMNARAWYVMTCGKYLKHCDYVRIEQCRNTPAILWREGKFQQPNKTTIKPSFHLVVNISKWQMSESVYASVYLTQKNAI